MTEATTAGIDDSAVLDERYGRGRRRALDKRIAWISGSVLVLSGLAFLLFSGWQVGSDLDYRDLDYEVVDEKTVSVKLQVTAPPGSEVLCALEAVSESYATVGWKILELPASELHTRQLTTSVVTTSPATTGTVKQCWMPAEA